MTRGMIVKKDSWESEKQQQQQQQKSVTVMCRLYFIQFIDDKNDLTSYVEKYDGATVEHRIPIRELEKHLSGQHFT